jgi:hypothetical protein
VFGVFLRAFLQQIEIFLRVPRLPGMSEMKKIQRQVERALAYVHAALDDESAISIAQARANAEQVLPRVASVRPQPLSLSEARQLYEYVSQLRAVLRALDGKLEAHN